MAKLSLLLIVALTGHTLAAASNVSISRITYNGITKEGVFAPGDLMFEDNFDSLNKNLWRNEINMNGGYNNEFQIYNNLDANAYVRNGRLYIRPTWSVDTMFGGNFEQLYNGRVDLAGCTDPPGQACTRQGGYPYILPPIVSARLRTLGTFSMRYGRIEVRAKMPHGDWQWPAIWMMPEESRYGQWPRSGEIDLVEVRGNRNLYNPSGVNIGAEQTAYTLHFGNVASGDSHWWVVHAEKNTARDQGYDRDFHTYTYEWGWDYLRFSVDGQEIKFVHPPNGGFYEMGGLNGENIWQNAENPRMAPFDQNFHFILNVATGGGYFPGDSNPRPIWGGNTNFLDFMNARDSLRGSWDDGGEENAMQVDYIRVYAI